MRSLRNDISKIINASICDQKMATDWLLRLNRGRLTRDTGNPSHFCCYFMPYSFATNRIFIVHHKKSGLWIAPGGHIESGETLMECLRREMEEELGVTNHINGEISPFLLTITPIDRPWQPCKEHFDIWYRFGADESDFRINREEFHDIKWVTIEESRLLVTDAPNLEAIQRMEEVL